MVMSLSQVLAHPSIAPAKPRVLTGSGSLERTVRWIHSSEVLEVAPLLRGGELLLTGGTMLARASVDEQRAYVRSLAARGVAGVAIETGGRLPVMPAPLLQEAAATDFPVVELRRVVPFVEVAEVINGALVNDSVVRLRSAGALSHEQSEALAEGGGVQEVLDALVRHTSTPAAVFDATDRLIAAGRPADGAGARPMGGSRDGDGAEDGRHDGPVPMCGAGPVPAQSWRPAPFDGMGARLTIRGAHVATLVLYPDTDADVETLELAQDRTIEALKLALLRSRPPGPRELAASELVRLAAADGTHPQRIRRLGESIGFSPDAPVIGVAAGATGPSEELRRLANLLSRYGPTAVDAPSPLAVHVLLAPRDRVAAANLRARLVTDLAEWHTSDRTAIAVGPLMPSLQDAALSLGAALECLRRPTLAFEAGVLDATELSAERMLLHDELRTSAERLVREQLGLLLALRHEESELLLATLEKYFETGFNKTRTAAMLHLQRQSLYARLQRAFDLLGGDPTGTPRALALHLALRLHRQLG
ncbi:PucR family transcriptional regulator [Streptomyces naganishii]|uniref:PucR family transcriptional regulator n=1 Tax=Streptomyces naganishii TaxID=285447 RepID=UPI0036B43252